MRGTALLLLFSLASVAPGQRPTTGVLLGRVLDAQSGAPIPGAELIIPSKDARTTTDSAGHYEFPALAGGVFQLNVRRLGYQQLSFDVSVVTGVESESDFRLTRLTTLDTVHTTAAAKPYISPALTQFEERRKAGIGHFIAEEEMRKNDDRTLGNTLRKIPGVLVFSYRSGEFVAAGRGACGTGHKCSKADPNDKGSPAGCFVAVYIDGIATYLGPPDRPPDLNKVLVRELAAAEFYAGGASLPVQFSMIRTSDCGVLLLWTRER